MTNQAAIFFVDCIGAFVYKRAKGRNLISLKEYSVVYMDDFFSKLVLSNEHSHRWTRHLLFWLACWLFQGFLYGFIYNFENQVHLFTLSFAESFIFLPQHMLLSYGIIYFVLPRFFFQGRYWWGVAGVLMLILIAALCSPLLNYYVIIPMRKWMDFPYNTKSVFFSFLGGLRGGMTVAGFAVAIKLLKYWYFKNTENERLEKEKLKAELELLKGQLHPHFMFNALNSIYSLALNNSDHTAEAIIKLSQLMRYMVTESSQSVIPLAEEVKIVKTYMFMEKNRFAERLDMTLNIQGDLDNKKIAPLLLLPFIENSFKHGTSQMHEQAWMSMDLEVKEDLLKLKLVNGKPEKATGHLPSGIGLQNVKKRLAMLYPGGHDLRITEDDSAFVVSLIVQLNKIQPGS
ncbi:MAG: hypothetical protein C0523_01205 [Cytophaga sp.]|nr:hypothetical protein [Cytophaga sp.]